MHHVIFIIKYANGETAFVPQGGAAGQALSMKSGDSVHWANDTDDDHLPWPYDEQNNRFFDAPFADKLSKPIKPHTASVALVISPGNDLDFFYRCRVESHLSEVGRIIVKV